MPAKPIAVLFADSHLQDRAWSYRLIEGDAYWAWQQIADFAIKYKVEAVVGAGDLLDHQVNHANPIAKLHTGLDYLNDHNIAFYYVQGQHEMEDTPWFSSHRAPHHAHKLSFKLGPLQAYGLDYQPAGKLQEDLNEIPAGTDLLIAHQVWGEFMGSIASPQGGIGDVPVVSTVFTGDYHKYEDIKTRGKDGQEVRVISPGSICLQDISEEPEKFFVVLMDDATFKKVKLKSRKLVRWGLIANEADLTRCVDTVMTLVDKAWAEAAGALYPEHIQKPLVHIAYHHRLADTKRRVNAAIGDKAHVFFKEIPPEKPEVATRVKIAQADGQRRAATLDTMLPGYLASKDLAHLEPDAQRLLQTQDVAGELRRMREEALA